MASKTEVVRAPETDLLFASFVFPSGQAARSKGCGRRIGAEEDIEETGHKASEVKNDSCHH